MDSVVSTTGQISRFFLLAKIGILPQIINKKINWNIETKGFFLNPA